MIPSSPASAPTPKCAPVLTRPSAGWHRVCGRALGRAIFRPVFPAVHRDRVLPDTCADQRLAGHLEAVRPAKPIECLLELGEDVLPGRARQPFPGFARKSSHIEPEVVECCR